MERWRRRMMLQGLFASSSSGSANSGESSGDSESDEGSISSNGATRGTLAAEEVVSESDHEAEEEPTQPMSDAVVPRDASANAAPAVPPQQEGGEDDDEVRILSPGEAAASAAAAMRRALNGDSEDDPAETGSPGSASGRKRKRPRVETRPQPTECTVCYDPCTITGRHRLVALKCGHLFGKKCIKRWVSERKTCPNCNVRVLPRDIFPLFTDHVAVVDNSGIEGMTEKFEAEKNKRLQVQLELAAAKLQTQKKMTEASNLLHEVAKWKQTVVDLRLQVTSGQLTSSASQATDVSTISSADGSTTSPSERGKATWHSHSQPSPAVKTNFSPKLQSRQSFQASTASWPALPSQLASVSDWKYQPVFDVAVKEARVFDLAASCSFLCVGECFYSGAYGVKMFSVSDPRHTMRVSTHSMPVRDLCISKRQDLVVTVAFDGKLAVTSLNTQSVVLQLPFPPDHRLGWSCALSDEDEFAMYCGFHDGTAVKYDMRKPTGGEQGIVTRFDLPEKQPVHSLKLFRSQAASRTEALAAATFNGLSVWNDISRLRGDSEDGSSRGGGVIAGEPDSHTAIGACCSLSASRSTPHRIVLSTRTHSSSPAKHLVFNLPVAGGSQLTPTATLLGHRTHPAIFRPATWTEANGSPMVASWAHDSKRVLLWDVESQRVVHRLQPAGVSADGSAPVVDIQHAVQGGSWNLRTALFGTLTAQHLSLYRWRNT